MELPTSSKPVQVLETNGSGAGAETSIDCNLLEPAKDFARGIVDEWSVKAREALWAKGQDEMRKAQAQAEARTAELVASLTKFRERQDSLAAENKVLKQYVMELFMVLEAAGDTSGAQLWPAFDPLMSSPPFSSRGKHSFLTPNHAPGVVAMETPSTAATQDGGSLAELPTLSLAAALGANDRNARNGAPLALDTALNKALNDLDPIKTDKAPAGVAIAADAPGTHTLTLHKTNDVGLGMDVSHCDADVILVEGVNPQGAAAAWNEEQRRRASKDTASYTPFEIRSGDRILRVNNVAGDAQKMLEECKAHNTLRLVIRRGTASLGLGKGPGVKDFLSGLGGQSDECPGVKDFLGGLGDRQFFLGGDNEFADALALMEPPGLETLGGSLP